MEKSEIKNEIVHDLFELTILLKGINGVFEIIFGSMLFFFSRATVRKITSSILRQPAALSSGNFARNYIYNHVNNFSFSAQRFLAIYLLFYGVLNIFLVVFLYRGKLWAYPVAIFFFILFMVYQAFRLYARHSIMLIFLTCLDICLTILTWLEYKRLKNKTSQGVEKLQEIKK